ncbi:uncharacterized protein LOC133823230 [Humulus lupulus]|uniref:uncharacterized protein LOC133823230 n=1 Tax=Humulus lupulus TaxID=3486 RepID=UPI002B407664|nr:uncharacterized protein LOC133823230 [Humulus lupulus]
MPQQQMNQASSSQQPRPQAPPDRPNEIQAALLTFTNTQTQFMTETRSSIRNLETQVGQLANMLNNRPQGNFPSNTEINPKEQCQEITLRNGKQIEQSSVQQPVVQNEDLGEMSDTVEQWVNEDHQSIETIPLVVVDQSNRCNIAKKAAQKLRDPGSFTIPYTIGKFECKHALCDLGASINLMPLSVFKKLGLGEARPTTVTLQLADQSVEHPQGIIEDVLVKLDKFIFPADFIVLNMEVEADLPIILGRPFLATGQALINVQKGELKLRVQGEEVVFNVFKAMSYPRESDSCFSLSVVDQVVSEKSLVSEALELALTQFGDDEFNDAEVMKYVNWVNSQGPFYRKKYEKLGQGFERSPPLVEKPPVLELKTLPEHLQVCIHG